MAGRGRPKGTDFFSRHPEVSDATIAILAQRKLSAPGVLELLETRFDALPDVRTLRRFIARVEVEHRVTLATFRDPDAYKSRFRVSLGTVDAGCDRAHQVWEIDTTKADVLTLDGRRAILGLIDRWTRRVRFLVAPSESAQSVRRLLATTMSAWGVMPETIVTDQGSGYINRTIASALDLLGIEHRPCPPASGDKKPFVERTFGTFTRERAAMLPGFVGHSVADAQKLRARARKETGRPEIVAQLTDADLQQILDAWVDGVYHQRPHGGTGETPIARWMASPVPAARAPSDAALKLALSAFVAHRTVGKRGIEWRGGRYWAEPLAALMSQTVELRRDEDDVGALFVFDDRRRFVCTAMNWERAGVSQEEAARAARADQARHIAQQRATMRARQREFSFDDAVAAVRASDIARAANVTPLPVRTIDRSTPAIESIDAAPAIAPRPATRRAAAPVITLPVETAEDRVQRADRLLDAHARGEPVDAAALHRARLYAQSTEYQSAKLMADAFGPAVKTA